MCVGTGGCCMTTLIGRSVTQKVLHISGGVSDIEIMSGSGRVCSFLLWRRVRGLLATRPCASRLVDRLGC